jgi:hypothetical protein
MKRGASLIDALIGIFIIATAFFAIFGVFRLSVNLVLNTKARIGAVALVNEQIEFLRSLPYDDVGTVGGIPSGAIPQVETVSLNNIEYTRRTFIQFVDAPEDGEGALDENGVTADYKRAKVEVSWNVRSGTKSFFAVSNIVPKGIETLEGGGTISITVIDALGVPIPSAEVHIENNTLATPVSVDTFTNSAGKVLFPGSPAGSSYEIIATKSGYSTAQTYDADAANPNPNPGHLTVVEGEVTSATFQIDILASKTVRTFSPEADGEFIDLFGDMSGISLQSSTTVSGGQLVLADFGEGYEPDGYAFSVDIAPPYVSEWKELSWVDTTDPLVSEIAYKVYFHDGSGWKLVPDVDLPFNSVGATTSPLDLSALTVDIYYRLQIAAFLSTADASTTPSLDEWRLSYSAGPTPLPDIPFAMRGDKTIGSDGGGNPIYKYEQNLQTDSNGIITLPNLEWDNYTITIDGAASGYDIAESCPPQPLALNPGASETTDLLLVPDTANSLLVAVTDSGGTLLEGASVRLYRGLFDETQTTSSCGQTFWGGLSLGSVELGNPYSLEVTLAGYQTAALNDVDVEGVSNITVVLDSI